MRSTVIVTAIAGMLAALLGLFVHLIRLWGQQIPHQEP